MRPGIGELLDHNADRLEDALNEEQNLVGQSPDGGEAPENYAVLAVEEEPDAGYLQVFDASGTEYDHADDLLLTVRVERNGSAVDHRVRDETGDYLFLPAFTAAFLDDHWEHP